MYTFVMLSKFKVHPFGIEIPLGNNFLLSGSREIFDQTYGRRRK